MASEFWRKRIRRGRRGGHRRGERDAPHHLATAGNEVIAVDWKGLKDVDQINMDSTSSLHGSSLHRPSTEVSTPRKPHGQLPSRKTSKSPLNNHAETQSFSHLPEFQDNIPDPLSD